MDDRAYGESILCQADASAAQVGTNLLVLHGVKAVGIQQCTERLPTTLLALPLGQQAIEECLHHTCQRRFGACRRAKSVEFGAAEGRECTLFGAQQAWQRERVVASRHERLLVGEQLRPRTAFVDRKLIDNRVHGKGHGTFQLTLG